MAYSVNEKEKSSRKVMHHGRFFCLLVGAWKESEKEKGERAQRCIFKVIDKTKGNSKLILSTYKIITPG